MTRENEARPLPKWLMVLGSLFVLGHFFILGVRMLNVRSGPWPTPFGESTALPPQFATTITVPAFGTYLTPLQMTRSYHFATNDLAEPEVKMEIRLLDSSGKLMKTVNIPGETGNPWLRHRYGLLAHVLAQEIPVQRRAGERVPAKEKRGSVEVWGAPQKGIRPLLTGAADEDIPEGGGFRPTPFAKTVAHSYVRYLCKEHGAASGELIRRSKPPVQPSFLLMPQIPQEPFQELAVSFGKVTP